MAISKKEREQIYNKYGGRCAYCGDKIAYKEMQVDHVVPLARGGSDSEENYMPACRTCNHYKRAMTVEGFRRQIGLLTSRMRERVYIYKVALKHGRITEYDDEPVKFYYEKEEEKNGHKTDFVGENFEAS